MFLNKHESIEAVPPRTPMAPPYMPEELGVDFDIIDLFKVKAPPETVIQPP